MTTSSVFCGACGKEAVGETVIEDTISVKHEGVTHEITALVPAFVCEACGDKSFDFRADQAVRRALRSKLNLLQPDEIRAIRTELGLRQEDIEVQTRIAAETISRWENDRSVQSGAHDQLLRFFFERMRNAKRSPEVAQAICVNFDVTWEGLCSRNVSFEPAPRTPQSPRRPGGNDQYALAA